MSATPVTPERLAAIAGACEAFGARVVDIDALQAQAASMAAELTEARELVRLATNAPCSRAWLLRARTLLKLSVRK